jgi:hypothetical protein
MYGPYGQDDDELTGGMGSPSAPFSAPPTSDASMAPSPEFMPSPPPELPSVPPVAMPAALPPVPVSRTVTPAESANLGAMDANTQARMGQAQAEGQLGVKSAEARADEATANSDARANYMAERQKIENEAKARMDARQKQADADFQAYRDFSIKDPQATAGFGRKLLTGIAVGMGAYQQSYQGGQNNALQIIQNANAKNIEQQKMQQEKLFKISEKSGEDVEGARKERDDAFHQLDLKHSALLLSSADELKKRLAQIGVPEAQIAANKDVLGLQNEALKIREGTLDKIRGDETTLARADIAAAAKRHKAGAGGGGSNDALTKFVEAAGQLQPGEPIPASVAVLGRQAGLKPNQLAAEIDRYRGSGNKAAKMGLQADKEVAGEAKDWAKQNGIAEIAKQQREFSGVYESLKENANDPLAQKLALEKMVSVFGGGAASRQRLALALDSLGAKIDKPEQFINKWINAGFSDKQKENLYGFLNSQVGEAARQGKAAYDNFNNYIESVDDPALKARLLQQRTKMFSGMAGFGGRKGTMSGDDQAAKGGTPARSSPAASSQIREAQQWIASHPDDPRMPAARAKLARMLQGGE